MTLLAAIAVLAGLGVLLGALLLWAGWRFRRDGDDVADAVHALLPHTQCAQCGFPGCRPYAEAVAAGRAEINQCPPGGEATVRRLAQLLGRDPLPLDPSFGRPTPAQVALIDESLCIGCNRCAQVCPVDAIVGAPQFMHTIVAADCTGCELCLPPCPVDCISLVPVRRAVSVPRPTKAQIKRALGTSVSKKAKPQAHDKPAHYGNGNPSGNLPGNLLQVWLPWLYGSDETGKLDRESSRDRRKPKPKRGPAQPCIRCGDCTDACPVDLLPQMLHYEASHERHDRLQTLRLFDCIECGRCDLACPSHIPLTKQFRAAKRDIAAAQLEAERAQLAERRHGVRQARLAQQERQRQEALAARKAQATVQSQQSIAEILERVRQKKGDRV